MPDIALDNLSKSFGALVAVDGATLTAADGELLTLLGPSGCGKTTTLRMIAGLEEPSGGSIRIGERMVYDRARGIDVPAEMRGLGMVFQSYAIWPHMTVAENVAFPLRMRHVARARQTRARRQGARSGRAWRARRQAVAAALSRRPAAARRAGAGAGVRAGAAVARRAACRNLDAKLREQMRFELQDHAAAGRPDRGLCHARPGRGADFVRPPGGDEPRRASSRSARRPKSTSIRRPVSSPSSSARAT